MIDITHISRCPHLSGYACAAMIANAFHHRNDINPDEMYKLTLSGINNNFTSMGNLMEVLRYHNVQFQYVRTADKFWWDENLIRGRIGIALVDYRKFTHNPGQTKFAQFVIPYGIVLGGYLVYDPLMSSGPSFIERSAFEQAISTPSFTPVADNLPNQAIMIEYGEF